jgi:hypothetical protein
MTSPEQADVEAMKAEVNRLLIQALNEAGGSQMAFRTMTECSAAIDRLAAVALHPAPSEPPDVRELVWKACIHASLDFRARDRVLTAFEKLLAATPQVHPAQTAPAPVDASPAYTNPEDLIAALKVDEPVDVPSPSDVHFAQAQGQAAAAPRSSEAEADCLALMKFYGARTLAELVNAQAHHIEKLQAKLPPTPSLAAQRVREG